MCILDIIRLSVKKGGGGSERNLTVKKTSLVKTCPVVIFSWQLAYYYDTLAIYILKQMPCSK